MDITNQSRWNLFLRTDNEQNAKTVVQTFLKENPNIEPSGTIQYTPYWKDNTMQATFFCQHTAPTWTKLVYDLILTAQESATGLHFTGSIDYTVDIFTNDVFGAKGGIRAISIVCDYDNNCEASIIEAESR